MKNIAIILAGGIGQRLGESIPKQFLKVAGKKLLNILLMCSKITLRLMRLL